MQLSWAGERESSRERPSSRYTNVNNSFELALGWFGNYDSYDLAALNLLSHGPPVSDDSPNIFAPLAHF